MHGCPGATACATIIAASASLRLFLLGLGVRVGRCDDNCYFTRVIAADMDSRGGARLLASIVATSHEPVEEGAKRLDSRSVVVEAIENQR